MADSDQDIMVATEGHQVHVGAELITVVAGTTARRGHPLVRMNPAYFRPQEVDYELEAKEETAPKNPVRAADKGARTR